MYKNDDLEDGVRVQVNKFDFVVMEKTKEDVASREPKSLQEKAFRYHHFFGIGTIRNLVIYDGF
jgi:hypothetical protein